MTRAAIRSVLWSAIVCLAPAVTLAQTPTTSTQTKTFTVVAVDGNQLVVRLPEGTRELTVAEDFRFNVDGKSLSVHELKPGMAGTATITTQTTVVPVTVTEVKNGTVMQALGTSIIVRTPEGMKMFSQADIDKRGVKIMREGKPAEISDFRANDRITATIITTKPPVVLTEQQVTARLAKSEAAPAPAPAPAAAPAAPRQTAPAPAPDTTPTTGAAPKTLPKTASPLPALALAGLASLTWGLGLTLKRRRATR
jgi:hypothetical protein